MQDLSDRTLLIATYVIPAAFSLGPISIHAFNELVLGFLGQYTRGSLLPQHAPATRSRVSTPTSTHEGHDEGAE